MLKASATMLLVQQLYDLEQRSYLVLKKTENCRTCGAVRSFGSSRRRHLVERPDKLPLFIRIQKTELRLLALKQGQLHIVAAADFRDKAGGSDLYPRRFGSPLACPFR